MNVHFVQVMDDPQPIVELLTTTFVEPNLLRLADNSWLVASTYTAHQLGTIVLDQARQDDEPLQYFVTGVQDYYGQLPRSVWTWVQSKLALGIMLNPGMGKMGFSGLVPGVVMGTVQAGDYHEFPEPSSGIVVGPGIKAPGRERQDENVSSGE